MDTTAKVSVNVILNAVLRRVNDENYREYGFSRGYYVSKIQEALEELAVTTFFDELTIDIKMDKKRLAIPLPENFFNLDNIYLWNGDCCTPDNSVNVWWKHDYNNKGHGPEHSTRYRDDSNNSDPFYPSAFPIQHHHFGGHRGVPTANIYNGLLMFSSDAEGYDWIRLEGNGYAGAIGDEPCIPRFLRRAIVDYSTEQVFADVMTRRQGFRTRWADAYRSLYDNVNGSWQQAENRIKSMHGWEKKSMDEYSNRGNW